MRGFLRSKRARWSALGLLFLALLALAAPWLAPKDPDLIDLPRRLLGPGSGSWLGTDALGRDLAARMLYGARISLGVGTLAVAMMTLIGILMGTLAGHYRGWVDMVITRAIDILLCIPTFYLILALIVLLGPGIMNVVVVLALTGWTETARLVRAEVLSLRDREFILSARAAGASSSRVMFRHLIPNALGPVYVSAAFGVAGAILLETGLSFLGLGVQPPTSSWGNILEEGRQNISTAWWLTVFPGLAILVTMLLVNSLGESVRRYFDSRSLDGRHG
ncbi:MAG: ABC transporter permease [candidate division FCPU426 bacterium]